MKAGDTEEITLIRDVVTVSYDGGNSVRTTTSVRAKLVWLEDEPGRQGYSDIGEWRVLRVSPAGAAERTK